MNTPEAQRPPGLAARIGQAPYLNGGLFERGPLDRQGIRVGDQTIEALLAPDGLFNRYHFTVTEATPLDTEVAVDPEMLGKLFEETVNERHSNGAYYTPRPVVAFMCRAALKGVLAGRRIPGLTAANLAELVDNGNADAITQPQAIAIAGALAAAKILDPACGSGAFLLGMMQEIIALNANLFRAGAAPEAVYRQKLDLISHNLHGADQDANAISIAMLRLWLSLAVDYDGPGAPPTLPNLDLKLVAGDALAGPDPQNAQGDFMAQSVQESRLGQLAQAYTAVKSPPVKERLRDYIANVKTDIRAQYRDAAPPYVVEWRVDFADVNQAGGFDIVIANPPYVRQEDIKPEAYKNALKSAYPDAAVGRSDLYCYFYARALQLLAPGGMHVFVCSNSWLDVGYGAKLQEYLLNNAHILAIYESAIERQFATADINTVISVIRKTDAAAADDATCFVQLRQDFDKALAPGGQRREIVKTRAQLLTAATAANKFVGDKWGGKYLRGMDIYHHILDQYGDKLVRLGDIATVKLGILTRANDFFFLTPESIAEWGIEDDFRRPVMTTPREARSLIVDQTTMSKQVFMCHQDKKDLKDTGALDYIQWGELQGYHRRSGIKARRRWYDLRARNGATLAMNYLIDTTARAFFAPDRVLFGDNFQELQSRTVSPLQLCAVMNSTVSQLMYNISGQANFGGGLMKIQAFETENLAIVNPSLLPPIDPALFAATTWDVLTPSPSRRQVDAAVFDALGLTSDYRDEVYAAVWDLVGNRKRRARSV